MALAKAFRTSVRERGLRRLAVVSLAILLLLFWPSRDARARQAQPPVVGQNSGTMRSIVGTVLSAADSPVAGSVVLLKDTKTLQVRSYIAQKDGKYHFFGLSTDVNYQLRAESAGMTSKTKTVSVFDSHKVVKLDLKLSKKLKT